MTLVKDIPNNNTIILDDGTNVKITTVPYVIIPLRPNSEDFYHMLAMKGIWDNFESVLILSFINKNNVQLKILALAAVNGREHYDVTDIKVVNLKEYYKKRLSNSHENN